MTLNGYLLVNLDSIISYELHHMDENIFIAFLKFEAKVIWG